jgi:hypothetical protein
MNLETKSRVKELLSGGVAKIVKNYTENALLINACFVSSERYQNITATDGLSTIDGIPEPLRLDNEIDVRFSNKDLIRNYEHDSLIVIYKNYVIFSISIVDATLEDIYEFLIRSLESNISEPEIERRVRNAWTNDNLISYFCAEAKGNFKKPEGMQTEILEAFMRYKELRVIRHALVHSDGALSEKNINLLRKLRDSTPDTRKEMAILGSKIINIENTVFLSIDIILSIRQYLDRFLMYLYKSASNA